MADEVTSVNDLVQLAVGQLAQGMVAAQLRGENMANQLAYSQGTVNNMATIVGVDKLINLGPEDAAALLKTISGNDMGQQILGQLAGLAGGGVADKIGTTAPPATAEAATAAQPATP